VGESTSLQTDLAFTALHRAEQRVHGWLQRAGAGPGVYDIRDAMGETMMNSVGIFREGGELQLAVDRLQGLLRETRTAVLRSKVPGMNPELSFALRLEGMLKLAICAATGALAREESRGAHHRTDFPKRDDATWLKRTLARWPADQDEPVLSYEPVGLLDLPPGDRGYGMAERTEMTSQIGAYNESVLPLQSGEGRIDTVQALGSRMQWGRWSVDAGADEGHR
jgi:fumarate reductase flavoprotein subunit